MWKTQGIARLTKWVAGNVHRRWVIDGVRLAPSVHLEVHDGTFGIERAFTITELELAKFDVFDAAVQTSIDTLAKQTGV
jgi:hypothetical protein